MIPHYIPREQFKALSEALATASSTGAFPECPVCGNGVASEETIRSKPDMWAIRCTCGHVVAADPNE